jgi:hypothetical protein
MRKRQRRGNRFSYFLMLQIDWISITLRPLYPLEIATVPIVE